MFRWYLGALWASFKGAWELFGDPWALLEITLEVLGFFWELCCRSRASLGVHLEVIWDTLLSK